MVVLFEYPKKAALNRIVPKSKFYERAKPTKTVKDKFVSQVAQVTWSYKLAPETTNLSANKGVNEIQVFTITAKSSILGEDVLRCIDKSIPSPIVFEVHFGSKVKVVAAYKRPNEADSSSWVVDNYFATDWIPSDTFRQKLPLVLDMSSLYERMLVPVLGLSQRTGESLGELVERAGAIRARKTELKKLTTKISSEKQFNRKVELNSELRTIQTEIELLSDNRPEK